jgi:hypothetical protein
MIPTSSEKRTQAQQKRQRKRLQPNKHEQLGIYSI